MALTHNLIQTRRLVSNQTTITFSNIPQTYTDLRLLVSARSTATGQVRRYVNVNINSSSSPQTYVRSIAYSTNNTVTDFDNVNSNYLVMTTDGADSGVFGIGELYFINYSGSTNKAVTCTSGALSSGNSEHMIGIWGATRSTTTAITSLQFTCEIGDFVAGSVFSLYGIKKL